MQEDHAEKSLLASTGKTPIDVRPGYGWCDEVQEDLQELSARGGKELAQNWKAWLKLVSETKSLSVTVSLK